MSMNKKIQDKSMNLDVKGQGTGCWNDCLVTSGYWERNMSTPNCNYVNPKFDQVTNPFW